MKVKNIALTIAILSFAVGFTDLQENIVFWLGRPVGAIAFVAYFIFAVLEKEFAVMDQQEAVKLAPSSTSANYKSSKKSSRNCAPALTTAISH